MKNKKKSSQSVTSQSQLKEYIYTVCVFFKKRKKAVTVLNLEQDEETL